MSASKHPETIREHCEIIQNNASHMKLIAFTMIKSADAIVDRVIKNVMDVDSMRDVNRLQDQKLGNLERRLSELEIITVGKTGI